MSTRINRSGKVTSFDLSVSADVPVTIDADDLHDGGWHHKSECGVMDNPALTTPLVIGGVSERDAIASLHRQAHPGQPGDPLRCAEEPCRSLSFDQVAIRLGRAS
jgi:hypothetical protein